MSTSEKSEDSPPLSRLTSVFGGPSSFWRCWMHSSLTNPPNHSGSSRSRTGPRRIAGCGGLRSPQRPGSHPGGRECATTGGPKWPSSVGWRPLGPLGPPCRPNGCAYDTHLGGFYGWVMAWCLRVQPWWFSVENLGISSCHRSDLYQNVSVTICWFSSRQDGHVPRKQCTCLCVEGKMMISFFFSDSKSKIHYLCWLLYQYYQYHEIIKIIMFGSYLRWGSPFLWVFVVFVLLMPSFAQLCRFIATRVFVIHCDPYLKSGSMFDPNT